MIMKTLLQELNETITHALKEIDDEELKKEGEEKLELTEHMKNIMNCMKIPVAFGCFGNATYVRYWGNNEIFRV